MHLLMFHICAQLLQNTPLCTGDIHLGNTQILRHRALREPLPKTFPQNALLCIIQMHKRLFHKRFILDMRKSLVVFAEEIFDHAFGLFIANDLFLAKELGIDAMHFNNYGSSLVFGHPQAPTLARLIMEAIEETVLKGGGYALVTGCAAGDSAACLIVKVG